MVGVRQEGRRSPSDPPAWGREWVPPRSPQSVPMTGLPQALPLPSRLTPCQRAPPGRRPREGAQAAPPTLPQGLPSCLPLGRVGPCSQQPPTGRSKARLSLRCPHLLVWGGSAGWADAVCGPRHRRLSPARPSRTWGQDGPAWSGPLHQGPEACPHWPAEGSHSHGRGD